MHCVLGITRGGVEKISAIQKTTALGLVYQNHDDAELKTWNDRAMDRRIELAMGYARQRTASKIIQCLKAYPELHETKRCKHMAKYTRKLARLGLKHSPTIGSRCY